MTRESLIETKSLTVLYASTRLSWIKKYLNTSEYTFREMQMCVQSVYTFCPHELHFYRYYIPTCKCIVRVTLLCVRVGRVCLTETNG